MRVVSTFAGIGGSSFGYEAAGWEVAGAVEFQEDVAEVYRLNHPGTDCWTVDVRRVTGADLRARFGGFDLLDGSPPCQAFSKLAQAWRHTRHVEKRHGDGSFQRSDDLVFQWARLAVEARPPLAVMENVSALADRTNRAHLLPVVAQLRAAGYRVEVHVLRAELVGTPSQRRRMFLLAGLDGLPDGPWPTLPAVPCSTVLPGPRLVWKSGTEREYSSMATSAGPAPTVGAVSLGYGSNWQSGLADPEDGLERDPDTGCPLVRRWQPEFRRAARYRPTRLVTSDEARRLMGFPPLRWPASVGLRSRRWALVGNSVPPPLSRVVAERMARATVGA